MMMIPATTSFNLKPLKVILTSDPEKNVFEVGRAIQIASSYIHKTTLRGGGQFIIVEDACSIYTTDCKQQRENNAEETQS
jgi:hypothetical protein